MRRGNEMCCAAEAAKRAVWHREEGRGADRSRPATRDDGGGAGGGRGTGFQHSPS